MSEVFRSPGSVTAGRQAATGSRFRASNPEHMDARRAAIIAATARVIVTNGVDSTRLADVAEEAGVSVGLIQHYFVTRDELLRLRISDINTLSKNELDSEMAAAKADTVNRQNLYRYRLL